MQLIVKPINLLTLLLGYEPKEIGKLFEKWKPRCSQQLPLVEISADI